jgi:hypothetical protein
MSLPVTTRFFFGPGLPLIYKVREASIMPEVFKTADTPKAFIIKEECDKVEVVLARINERIKSSSIKIEDLREGKERLFGVVEKLYVHEITKSKRLYYINNICLSIFKGLMKASLSSNLPEGYVFAEKLRNDVMSLTISDKVTADSTLAVSLSDILFKSYCDKFEKLNKDGCGSGKETRLKYVMHRIKDIYDSGLVFGSDKKMLELYLKSGQYNDALMNLISGVYKPAQRESVKAFIGGARGRISSKEGFIVALVAILDNKDLDICSTHFSNVFRVLLNEVKDKRLLKALFNCFVRTKKLSQLQPVITHFLNLKTEGDDVLSMIKVAIEGFLEEGDFKTITSMLMQLVKVVKIKERGLLSGVLEFLFESVLVKINAKWPEGTVCEEEIFKCEEWGFLQAVVLMRIKGDKFKGDRKACVDKMLEFLKTKSESKKIEFAKVFTFFTAPFVIYLSREVKEFVHLTSAKVLEMSRILRGHEEPPRKRPCTRKRNNEMVKEEAAGEVFNGGGFGLSAKEEPVGGCGFIVTVKEEPFNYGGGLGYLPGKKMPFSIPTEYLRRDKKRPRE